MKLLINEADFKKQINVSASYNFDPIKPHVNNVQRLLLIPMIGQTLFNTLKVEYNDATPALTADQTELLTYIHPMLANLAMMKYAAKGNVMWTDSGGQVNHSGDLKSAFQWQILDARRSFLNTGYESLELLLLYLEENAADFADYTPATNRTRIINSAADFCKHVKIRRYEYELIKPVMDRVERNVVQKYLGKLLYDDIKASIAAGSLTADEEAIMTELQALVAHVSYSQALTDLAVTVDDDGIHMYNDAFSGNFGGKEPANAGMLNRKIAEHKQYGDQASTNLIDHLNANPTDYPLFEDSDFYEGDGTAFDESESSIIDL